MVIIHIANIDLAVIGGVQVAVPKMVKAQSQYADVAFLNTRGDDTGDLHSLSYDGRLEFDKFPPPFNKPDLVIFHEVYRIEYIGIYRTLIRANIPYIIIPHGSLSKTAQQKKRVKKILANLLLFHKFLKFARAIQYLSDNEKNLSAFPQYAPVVLGNGIEIPVEKKLFFSKHEIKLTYIGRLDLHIKGLDLLLGAVKKCETAMREKQATVRICGPDFEDAHKRIQQMIEKLNIADLVCVDREKVGEEKKKVLLSSDCFIQTSRTEGLPLGPLEALGYGLPCIVTEGVGLGAMIESYGAGYRCSNTEDGIANAIERFIQNFDKAETMSKAAMRIAEKEFDINIIAEKTVHRYCGMVK